MKYAGHEVEEVLDEENHRGVEMRKVRLETGGSGWVYEEDLEQ